MELDVARQRKEEAEDALLELISQILDELELRLLDFADQAGEKIFVGHPEISSHFDTHQVMTLKSDLREAAEAHLRTMIGALADEELWLGDGTRKAGRDSLRQNTRVWTLIQAFADALVPVLKRYGYPHRTGTLMAPYKELELRDLDQLPKSEQLRMLVMKYWIQLTKYQQIHSDFSKVNQVANHKALNELWQRN
jgi:hypothetical protein